MRKTNSPALDSPLTVPPNGNRTGRETESASDSKNEPERITPLARNAPFHPSARAACLPQLTL